LKKHNSPAVDEVLAGYEGYLVADAHAVCDHLYRDGPVTEVNPWAHARRYLFEAMNSDPERARPALALINALFRIERHIANSPRKKRENIRRAQSAPIVDRFFSWCEAEREQVLDDTPLAKGIRYALNQREGLSRFLNDGRLPLHNNMSELQLRRQAVGRKDGYSLAAKMARSPIPPLSRYSPAVASMTSSHGPIFATSSVCCRPGRSTASSSSLR